MPVKVTKVVRGRDGAIVGSYQFDSSPEVDPESVLRSL